MAHSEEVLHADRLRRDGSITWEEYKSLLRGKFVASVGDMVTDIARGIRDRDGRLRELRTGRQRLRADRHGRYQ